MCITRIHEEETKESLIANGDIFGEISFLLNVEEEVESIIVNSESAEIIRLDRIRLNNIFKNDEKLGSKFFLFLSHCIKRSLRDSGKIEHQDLRISKQNNN